MSTAGCTQVTPECPVSATTYGYTPNLAGNVIFAAVFGVCAIYHVVVGIKARSWTFMTALGIGAAMETVGYGCRLAMRPNPWDQGPFSGQIICLILAPSFVAAAIYWSLKHIVLRLGPEKSRLRPNLYPWIFIGCDIGSILLQAAGGGVAGSAGSDNVHLLDIGNNIMLAGIAFQVATMAVCGILAVGFMYRVRASAGYESVETKRSLGRGFYVFCAAEVFAYITVLIRCIYRLPEMAGGWGNPLMQNEKEFLILDGMMVCLAVIALTACHPYWLCPSVLKK